MNKNTVINGIKGSHKIRETTSSDSLLSNGLDEDREQKEAGTHKNGVSRWNKKCLEGDWTRDDE